MLFVIVTHTNRACTIQEGRSVRNRKLLLQQLSTASIAPRYIGASPGSSPQSRATEVGEGEYLVQFLSKTVCIRRPQQHAFWQGMTPYLSNIAAKDVDQLCSLATDVCLDPWSLC